MSLRILHVHSGNIFGGVERMLETLAPATAGQAPIRSDYALCFDGQTSAALRAAGGVVHELGLVHARRPDQILRARRSLAAVLHSGGWSAAVVHSAWSQAIFGPTVLESGMPLVRWLHAPQPGPRWLEYWASLSPPALVLCNSLYTRNAAGTRFGGAPIAVQYPPAALAALPADTRRAVRSELGTPPEAVVIALAARFETGKGHRRLIDALARVRQVPWEAWIVGGAQSRSEQAYAAALRRRADEAGIEHRVRFLGPRSDVHALLAAADLYCQPNEAPDSFGLSFVEALAAGLPVVTTRLGGAPEIVDERCGVLIDPSAPNELAEVLQRLGRNPEERRAMSVAAHARVREFCDLPMSLTRLAAELSRAATPPLTT